MEIIICPKCNHEVTSRYFEDGECSNCGNSYHWVHFYSAENVFTSYVEWEYYEIDIIL